MFTIILIFLLFSFSNNPETMTLEKNLKLPDSSSKLNYKDSLKMVLTKSSLMIEDKVVATIKNNKILGLDKKQLEQSELYKQLKQFRQEADKLEENIAKSETEKKDKRHILFLCDQTHSFKVINSIVKVAGKAGYPNFQFAVLEK